MYHWQTKPFNTLTAQDLYAILQLRAQVFVVEQNCPYLDLDGKDAASHVMCMQGTQLVAYTRILPIGIAYPNYASIGRVVNASSQRGTGLGKKLMEHTINQLYTLYGKQPIKIGAQFYLKSFYESFGFNTTGEVYDEDGIPHIAMLLP
jgi:ElaA protein